MNAPQQAAPAAPAAPTETRTTLEERTSNVLQELRGDAPKPAEPSKGDDALSPGKAARAARLAALREKDRERVDHKQRQAEQDKLTRRAADLERRATDAEAQAAKRVDVDELDEGAFLALAEKKGITGPKLAEWIRKAVDNPEQIAAAAALKATTSTYDPKFAALEQKLAEQQKTIDSYITAQQQQQISASDEQNVQHFTSFVTESKETAPLASRLLEHDRDEFLAMADVAGHNVPEGAGPEALLDAIEDLLDGSARSVYTKYAPLFGAPASAPSTASASPPPRAAAKANTISNSLAASRTSVVEEEDFASLSLDERAARLIKQLG